MSQSDFRRLAGITNYRVLHEVNTPDDEGILAHGKDGEWNLHLRKYSASRWSFTLVNPTGGSFGTGSFPNQKQAVKSALSGASLEGTGKVWVTVGIWDSEIEQYRVTKSYWLDPSKKEEVEKEFAPEELGENKAILQMKRLAGIIPRS